MTIDANTKISALLRENPATLEAIVSLSPKFNKLRNPLLRKLMASRTTIRMASKIGGCTEEQFLGKLKPLGFTINEKAAPEESAQAAMPHFMKTISPADIVPLDVRPVLNEGKDPFNLILGEVRKLRDGQALKLLNEFEPIPLINLLEKQGFKTYTELISDRLCHTYFFKDNGVRMGDVEAAAQSSDWEEQLARFGGKMKSIDVRELEMPLPMLTILEELDQLPQDQALYVHHKRLPLFLLPELEERGFGYRFREIGEGDVKMLFFKE